MNISIKPARLWTILGIMSVVILSAFQSQAASRSVCLGSPANFSTLQTLSVVGSGHSTVTLAGCRGCAYVIETYYTGTASDVHPGDDYAYAQYTFQDGTFYGSTLYSADTDTADPCNQPFAGPSAIDHGINTMHGQDKIDLYYVNDSGCSGVEVHYYDVTILDAYDDAGDIVFDVTSLPADGVSKAHARVTNPKAFPAGVLVWQINGSTDEDTLGCTINPTTGEITAGKVAGKITVRAYCSDTPDCWIEEDLKVGCGTCQNGCTDGSITVGSVLISINMGNTAFGDSAGMFQIDQAYPSAALSTPTILKYYSGGLTTNDVTVTRSNGIISQVIAPQLSAGVVSNSAYQYQIIIYTNSTLTGTPWTTWTIQNPDGASSSNRLFVFQVTDGLTNEYDYIWNGTSNGWELTTEGGAKVEARYNSTNGVLRTETHLISDGSANIKFQETNVYQTFAWGEQQIQNTVGSGTNALVTTWAYYTNSVDTTNYSRLYQMVTPGNHWERYAYDTNGLMTYKVTQYLDNDNTTDDTANRQTFYYYYTSTGSSAAQLTYTYSSVSNVEVGENLVISYGNEVDTYRGLMPGALTYGDPNYGIWLFSAAVTEVTTPFVGLPQITQAEDGTYTFYSYALSADGNYRTNIVTTGQADGGFSYIVDGTETVTVLNKSGNKMSQQTYDIASGLLTSSATTLATDTRGRPTTVQYLDGTTETTEFGCCGIESFTDRQGITASYSYDPYTKQVTSATRAGITTQSMYDAAGNLIQTTRIGTDSSSITQNVSTFDAADRLTSSTPADNGSGLSLTTTYADYFDGSNHRIKTTTNPDTGTRVETYYQDGSLLSITGTGVHPLQYLYGVDFYGEYTSEIKTGPNGETNEFSQAYKDFLGRNYFTWFDADSLYVPYTASFFNFSGQLSAQLDRDGLGTVFVYNAKGQLQDTVVDLYRDGYIHYGGNNRITRTVSDVTTNNGTTVLRTRTYVWATNGVDASNLVSTVETSADGLNTWSILWNNGVGVTNASTTFYAGSGNRYVTNTAPDGSYNIAYYQNDLLMSVTSKDSGGTQIGQISYGYDAHGRQYQVTDARTGTITNGFNDADQINSVTTPAPGAGQSAQVTTNYFDAMGRTWKTTLPDNTSVTNEFYLNGDLKRTYGSRTYPVAYGYDSQGRVTTMTNWTSFASGAGARVTTWNYDGYTGFMTNKVYDGNVAGPSYTFTGSGKPLTRTWARGITTTYGYSQAGDLKTITYSDGTSGITNGFDRLGRQSAVTNGTTVCNFAYNNANELLSESYSGGMLAGLSVTNGYDPLLRRTALALASQSSTLSQFGYDAASRLSTVTNGSQTVTYAYLTNSPLVQSLTFKQSGTTRLTTTKSYDNLNRLTSILSSSSSITSSFAYAYNSANQRTAITNADNSRWAYQYDALGQVTSGKKYWSDNAPVAGQQFTYGFDDIGNRTNAASGGDTNGDNLRVAGYLANNLNQLTNREIPGYVDVIGSATNPATVTMWGDNGQYSLTSRKTNYFRGEVPLNNSTGAVWLTITNLAVLNNGTNADIIATNIGSKFVAKTPEQFTYDADGNLTSDGRWTNTWSAENRLISQVSFSNVSADSKYKVDYTYDYSGRMIQRIVSTNSGASYAAYQTNRYVYDGKVQLAELDGNNNLMKSYMRGLDLSGSFQGAGGTGGLLAINAGSNGTHFYAMDGNGNVMALVNTSNGTISAQYDYSPFGEMLRASGPMAFINTLGFSSQYTDYITRQILYLNRPYNASTGTWPSKDPIGEQGGLNLYGFVGNDSLDRVDVLGLEVSIDRFDPKHPGGRCDMNQTCRDNIRLLLALIGSSSQRLVTDFTSAYLKLAKGKAPIPPEQIYNPNVTDYRTSWNNHVQELINTLARATECVTVIGAQKKDGKCGCCKWFDDKRIRWREQEVERLRRQVPNTVNRWYWITDSAGAFVESSVSLPNPAVIGVAAGATLLAVPGGEPGGVILVRGCLQGL